jgi:hypothetical protein
MEQDPSREAKISSAGQEISCNLWNPSVHYRIQNSPTLVHILNHIIPVHDNSKPYFLFKINANVILPSFGKEARVPVVPEAG